KCLATVGGWCVCTTCGTDFPDRLSLGVAAFEDVLGTMAIAAWTGLEAEAVRDLATRLLPAARADRRVNQGQALEKAPATEDALAAGRIGGAQAGIIPHVFGGASLPVDHGRERRLFSKPRIQVFAAPRP